MEAQILSSPMGGGTCGDECINEKKRWFRRDCLRQAVARAEPTTDLVPVCNPRCDQEMRLHPVKSIMGLYVASCITALHLRARGGRGGDGGA